MNLTDYLTQEKITQAALGEMLGVSQGSVAQWQMTGRRVPAEHCPVIERLSNRQVTCEELRPDIDWAYLRAAAQPADTEHDRRATDAR
jgi:DNA-binding transcriptional regulator YdaS (Cro superfamily)